ncbi:metallophosphoesterase family protein, partial [Asaia krungthepensis]
GSTLWTDCRLYGRPEFHGRLVERALNDSRFIRGADGVTDGPGGFTASEAARRHEDSRAFLARELGAPHADPTIVVRHHLASLRGIAARYSDGPVNAGFASNRDDLLAMGAALLRTYACRASVSRCLRHARNL